jgi:hypothetical protein
MLRERQAVRTMTMSATPGVGPGTSENEAGSAGPESITAGLGEYLIRMAARAPSVHNTQPWRFRVSGPAIEMYADPRRKLHTDPLGRQLLISCGAALFGLRLAIRSLGRLPVVTVFPETGSLRLLARVRLGAAVPVTAVERALLAAVPHRHTHRGPFQPGPLPAGLLARLQHDAVAEGATLAIIDTELAYQKLAAILAGTHRRQDLDPVARAELRRWTRSRASTARDGVPARAFLASPAVQAGRLPQRDFDLSRGLGLPAGEHAPYGRPGAAIRGLQGAEGPRHAATAMLLTAGDSREDWLRAGQALNRLLLEAASQWVFASLHSQPLEAAAIRALITDSLALPGHPQMLLQLGAAHTTQTTPRRPATDLIDP